MDQNVIDQMSTMMQRQTTYDYVVAILNASTVFGPVKCEHCDNGINRVRGVLQLIQKDDGSYGPDGNFVPLEAVLEQLEDISYAHLDFRTLHIARKDKPYLMLLVEPHYFGSFKKLADGTFGPDEQWIAEYGFKMPSEWADS